MNIQVPGCSRTEILVVPPAKKLLGIERAFFHLTQVSVPIDGVGSCTQRDGILPCSQGIVTVDLRFRKVDLANYPLTNEFSGFLMDNGAHILATYLKYLLILVLSLDYLMALLHKFHHRLFAIHMLPGL